MCIMAVMRCRRKKQQTVAAPRQHLRETAAVCGLLRHIMTESNAMMRLIENHQIPAGPLQFLQNVVLLREIECRDTQRNGIEWIGAEFMRASHIRQFSRTCDTSEFQTESQSGLLL